jgi:hypothetical protein
MFFPVLAIGTRNGWKLSKDWGAARERMRQLAEQTPGPYFVFSIESKAILAAEDTTLMKEKKKCAAS